MASFEVVEVRDGITIPLGHLGVFPSGKMAKAAAESMGLLDPKKKFQPRPKAVGADWRKRELDKNHPSLPWGEALPLIADHFARVCPTDGTQIQYFVDEKGGKMDRLTTIHVNRYLVTYFSQLDDDTRRNLVWQFTGETYADRLRFSSDYDEIKEIYMDGPESCMSHSNSYYADGNPVGVYAGPDLQLAYIKNDYDRIVARTIVWPEKKIFSTIYGDSEKMQMELKRLGYRYSRGSEFEGARLLLEPAEGEFDDDYKQGYLCPYIDFASSVEPIGDYLVVTRKGTYDCQSTSGVAERCACTCSECGEKRNGDGFAYIRGQDKSVCEDCADRILKTDAYTGYYIDQGDERQISHGRYVASYNFDNNTFTCPTTGLRYLKSEFVLYQGVKYSADGLAQIHKAKAA